MRVAPFFFTFVVFIATSRAGIETQITPSSSTDPTSEATGYLTGHWGGLRDELEAHGVTLSAHYTGEYLQNPVGGSVFQANGRERN